MKKIVGISDLAINGAAPAFSEPLHVGRPNIGRRADLLARIESLLDRRVFTNNGPLVREFEARVAEYLGVRHCVAVSNGTTGIQIAARALGLRGEVIVPSFTFVATAHALEWLGITPVFVDIDPLTHTISPECVERAITPRTTGIVGVHVWGFGCAVEELARLAQRHGLRLMFDAAHAFACSHRGKMIGHYGECEVLSFHATKFMNTFEGGAVVTNDGALAEKLRLMRKFGFDGVDRVVSIGINGKMPEVCAAMGLTGMDAIEDLIAVNRRNYDCYSSALAGIPGLRMIRRPTSEPWNYHYVVAEVADDFPVSRDDLVSILHAENVLVRRYFYPGVHEMQPYAGTVTAAHALPHTVALCKRVISFPTGTAVSPDDIEQIACILRAAAEHGATISGAQNLRSTHDRR